MFEQTRAYSGFSVNDPEAAKQFYSQTLGAGRVRDGDAGRLSHAGPEFVGSGPVLVYPKPDHAPASFTILNFPVADIEEAVDELQRRGVRFEHYEGELKTDKKGIHRDAGGPPIAWFRDPAGNVLSVLEETR